jgi:branched-chain amino acid transport system permease protein
LTFALMGQAILVGLNLAATYATMALGLTLMFGMLGVVNLAHGVLYMLGAYGIYYLYGMLGLNFYIALVATMVTLGFFGLFMERAFYRPVGGQFEPFITISLALLVLLETGANLTFGYQAKGVTAPVAGITNVLGVGISNYRLLTIFITALLIGALYYLIYRTRIGLYMRAVEEDKVAAAIQGVNVNQVNAIVFLLSVALAGASGALIAPLYTIFPFMGTTPMLKAFAVIILGGMGNIIGAILGAIVIGLADSLLAVSIGPDMAYIVTWAVIIAILIFRPKGLLGAY